MLELWKCYDICNADHLCGGCKEKIQTHQVSLPAIVILHNYLHLLWKENCANKFPLSQASRSNNQWQISPLTSPLSIAFYWIWLTHFRTNIHESNINCKFPFLAFLLFFNRHSRFSKGIDKNNKLKFMLVCILLHISASANKRKFEVFHMLKNTYFKLYVLRRVMKIPKELNYLNGHFSYSIHCRSFVIMWHFYSFDWLSWL